MRPGVVAIAVLVFALAACGGSKTLPASHLSRYVLQPSDLGAQWAAFESGPQIALDNQGTPRADPRRFGREGGWIARYKRSGTAATRGPLVVVSRADVFKAAGGAKSDLEQYRATFAEAAGAGVHSIAVPTLGDETTASTFTQPGTLTLRFYSIAWRYRNATASVTVEGWDGKLRTADAVALARKQQARLVRS
jgi:hypothetical protein